MSSRRCPEEIRNAEVAKILYKHRRDPDMGCIIEEIYDTGLFYDYEIPALDGIKFENLSPQLEPNLPSFNKVLEDIFEISKDDGIMTQLDTIPMQRIFDYLHFVYKDNKACGNIIWSKLKGEFLKDYLASKRVGLSYMVENIQRDVTVCQSITLGGLQDLVDIMDPGYVVTLSPSGELLDSVHPDTPLYKIYTMAGKFQTAKRRGRADHLQKQLEELSSQIASAELRLSELVQKYEETRAEYNKLLN